jgi:hypothetical protein
MEIGTRTVTVWPCSMSFGLAIMLPSALRLDGAQVRNETRQALRPQADVRAFRADVDPRHKQMDDPRLLGGKEFVPKRVEPF